MGIANVFRSFRLPTHWHVRTDEEGKDFYWNSHTFKKQSKKPTALPMGWHEQINLETREVYIYNILTRQSRAAPPERQVQQPPPERLSPPPPTIEMYEESVRQSRRHTISGVATERETVVSERASSMGDPKVPSLHTHRAAARAGVPVTVDPFSLRNRTGRKTSCGPAWPSSARLQLLYASRGPFCFSNQAHAGAAPSSERETMLTLWALVRHLVPHLVPHLVRHREGRLGCCWRWRRATTPATAVRARRRRRGSHLRRRAR